MPDHIHVLATVPSTVDLPHLITQWKRYLARTQGVRWQRDFFEHRLRSSERAQERVDYLRANPVRAGLVRHLQDWPWFWSFQRAHANDHGQPTPGTSPQVR